MHLVETHILQSQMAAPCWAYPLEPELALSGCVRQPQWPPPIVEHNLAVPKLRESE